MEELNLDEAIPMTPDSPHLKKVRGRRREITCSMVAEAKRLQEREEESRLVDKFLFDRAKEARTRMKAEFAVFGNVGRCPY